ncbi:type II toxin-antitoxin system death-on-curing family toxin [Candidatus Microgenomates bacterium]|nr:MAG: type II toxin-antitoxin system death-on-curing family toxin [Candidatus Microgenomates bacterium]
MAKTIFPTLEQVLDIHEEMLSQFGGTSGINDFTLLHSAVERPKASFGGIDLYPDIFTKAAALIQSVVLNHPFHDGNKRTALTLTALFLHMNGYKLLTKLYGQETYEFMVGIDFKKYDFDAIVSWLKAHTKKRVLKK